MDSFAAFILAHEDFAESLKQTAEKITGQQPNIFPYSNKIDSLPLIFEKISEKYPAVNFVKINVDKQPFISESFNVRGIPAFFILKGIF